MELIHLSSVLKLISSHGSPDGYVPITEMRSYLTKRSIEIPEDNLIGEISEKYFTELKKELQKLKS